MMMKRENTNGAQGAHNATDDKQHTRGAEGAQEHALITPHEFIDAVMPEPQGESLSRASRPIPTTRRLHDHPKVGMDTRTGAMSISIPPPTDTTALAN